MGKREGAHIFGSSFSSESFTEHSHSTVRAADFSQRPVQFSQYGLTRLSDKFFFLKYLGTCNIVLFIFRFAPVPLFAPDITAEEGNKIHPQVSTLCHSRSIHCSSVPGNTGQYRGVGILVNPISVNWLN